MRPHVVAAALSLAAVGCSRPLATMTFACAGGDSLVVGVGARYAELHLPPDRVVRLPPERGAAGTRYTDGRYTLVMTGAAAMLERGGRSVREDCRRGPAAVELDSAPAPRRARAVADSIDALTASMTPAVRRLQAAAHGADKPVLRFWAEDGHPLKLSVVGPVGAGGEAGRTDFYFPAGTLEVVRGPVSQYVFRDTTLILWTTDSLQVVSDIPLRDMVARQNFVLGEVRQYLAMFGIDQ